MTTAASKNHKGFAYGKLIVMRPVVEDDLPQLARLMAECPCDGTPTPWTHQRLKKKFEDKDKPGLWDRGDKYFSVLRSSGEIVGFLHEREDENRGVYWNAFQVFENLGDRAELMTDLLTAYLAYKQAWHNPLRIGFDALRPETGKIAALEQAGFELELVQERKMLYLGKPEALCIYSWFSDTLKQAPGWDDPAVAD